MCFISILDYKKVLEIDPSSQVAIEAVMVSEGIYVLYYTGVVS